MVTSVEFKYDSLKVGAAAEEILHAMGIDVEGEFTETPDRVSRFFAEFCNPTVNLLDVLKDGFHHEDRGTGGMVIQTGIPYRGLCSHHLLPVYGTAAIGYVPNRRIVGLSKLARLVDAAGTRRPDTQEAVTNDIADTLVQGMEPLGVIVVTSCAHSCMVIRGIKAIGTVTKVSALRGVFRDVPAARQEFLQLANV